MAGGSEESRWILYVDFCRGHTFISHHARCSPLTIASTRISGAICIPTVRSAIDALWLSKKKLLVETNVEFSVRWTARWSIFKVENEKKRKQGIGAVTSCVCAKLRRSFKGD